MQDINKISQNYKTEFKGKTSKGISKKIFAIIGNIVSEVFAKLMDENGIYLKDKNDNFLLIKKVYEEEIPELYIRIMDKNGMYLRDKNYQQLFIKNE